MITKPKIGLTLAAGGAKGLCHIGTLKVLIDNNIPLHAITGTSSGALIGGMYAYTKNIKVIEELALSIKKAEWNKIMLKDFSLFGKGLMSGVQIEKIIESIIGKGALIEHCQIPFRCACLDLYSGKKVIFSKGSMAKAIRASISLPVTFKPVEINGQLLVDGSAICPAPTKQLLLMGCNRIIVSSTAQANGLAMIGNPTKYSILHNYMMNSTAELIRRACSRADVVLHPRIDAIDTLEFWKGREAMNAGIIAAQQSLKEIKKLKRWF